MPTYGFCTFVIYCTCTNCINVVSNVVVSARLGNAAYSASKSALLGLTKVMAIELAHLNIRVNAISPGGIYVDQDEKFV